MVEQVVTDNWQWVLLLLGVDGRGL